jgi:hypothetical protein
MADKKISQLTALSAANLAPSTDVLAVVDTSATETKKIVAQDLVNGVLNVASAVGIGTTSPSFNLQVNGSTGIAITGMAGVTTSAIYIPTGGILGDNLGTFEVRNAGGTSSELRLSSRGNTTFFTGGSGDLGTGTEKVRITSGGAFCVGSSDYATAIVLAKSTAAGTSVYNSWNSATSGTRFHFEFRDDAGATSRGSITTDGTNTAYNTSSDRRLKENIAPSAEAGSVIDGIEVVEFDWKSGSHTRFGMIAQDLNVVAPEAVTAGDDGEEIEKSWSVDYSKLVPMLVKEIQSLRARVAALESA